MTDLKQTIAELEQRLQASLTDRDELLQQRAATNEVLQVINASSPVFDAILERAMRLCQAEFGLLATYDGVQIRTVAARGVPPAFAEFRKNNPPDYGPGTGPARILAGERVVHIVDLKSGDPYRAGDPNRRAVVDLGGARTVLLVPLQKNESVLGYITIYRKEVRPYSDKQIVLLKNFADQAVIAIENARLFNETKEALEQQTATAEILKVIASSPSDVQPVFKAIAASANKLIGGLSTTVFSVVDDMVHLSAFTPTSPAADAALKESFPRPLSTRTWNEDIRVGRTVQIPDTEIEYANEPDLQEMARKRGFRGLVIVPLLRDRTLIGTINVTRVEPGRFAGHHVQLLRTFADQAVIAIENARLFNETKESLERQTATSEILKVIASSPSEVKPVFEAIATSANRLIGGFSTAVFRFVEGIAHLAAFTPTTPAADEVLQAGFPSPLSRFEPFKLAQGGQPVQIPDIEALPGSQIKQIAQARGFRSMLLSPLMNDGTSIGLIGVMRLEPGEFAAHHIQLMQTFADQAVIAIENARLFDEVQARTLELSKSLDDLRTAQDRLVQTEKLASLGQLTAGIAREIKNPLNFVNNFSALSAELIEEMKDMLSDVSLDKNKREDLNEITQMLKDNLEKVVQHGRRADSIVKNMLLHSREGSGEHRPVEINVIVDESLNLAYHGARAEKAGFNIIMQRNFDPAAGVTDVYPQEITRALLNLISNGFYATTKRGMEASNDFKPTLSAATKNLGEKVEIRIRDNGTGIPAEVKEKIFNPFFTTKPAGEGTGLGLSMSHDIIVKQHGGTLDVETEPGLFTEFRIVLPRTSQR